VDTGQVRYSFRDFPLASHSAAPGGAVALRCASQQGRFWEMLAALFGASGRIGPALYTETAKTLGLDVAAFDRCAADPGLLQKVEEERAAAERMGVQATPHFVLGRLDGDRLVDVRPLTGAHSFETFATVIEEMLASAGGEKAAPAPR
jgi:protein-disulfide isomerase